jgi:hypothetical protein
MQDAIETLRDAVARHGLTPGQARKRRGRPGVTLTWHRPEPVTLRLRPGRELMLEAYLPFVLPGGKLHQRLKACAAPARCISRDGNLSLALPGGADALPELLALATRLRDMLHAEWPDYAGGVFAAALK